ncbi:MAG: hypothetical protein H7288_11355 [Kineosporiaceae bacterium]|nr:hypothetical protein [Aeromicrobium sp.]
MKVVDKPLLEQLDEAIRSNMGGSTRGASDPAARAVANLGALMKMMQISSQIMDWARIVGSVIDKPSMVVTLERWHVKYIGGVHDDAITAGHARMLTSWAEQIEALLDPPREMDFEQNCPTCGSDCWWSPADKASYPRPIVVKYRPGEPIDSAEGLCRACKTVFGARELQFELEKAQINS